MNGDGFFSPVPLPIFAQITFQQVRPSRYSHKSEECPIKDLQKEGNTLRRCLCPHISPEEVFMDYY
jgi:hypothetical protein